MALPIPEVDGYGHHQSDQPYHVELWVEKTTMNDVLDPVCRVLGINLIPTASFASITRAIELLQRASGHRTAAVSRWNWRSRPCVVLLAITAA